MLSLASHVCHDSHVAIQSEAIDAPDVAWLPAPRGRAHGVRFWLLAGSLAAVLIAIGAVLVAATGGTKDGTQPSGAGASSPHKGAWVELRSGTYRGTPWRLDARYSQGQLCISVDSPKGPADVLHGFAGACGFENAPDKGADYFASGPGPGPDAAFVNYGPLPSEATSVRVATHEIVPSYPFPAVAGLPKGRYWIDIEGLRWPSPDQGKALLRPQPLDAQGNPASFTKF
jgi:hypothetical protein